MPKVLSYLLPSSVTEKLRETGEIHPRGGKFLHKVQGRFLIGRRLLAEAKSRGTLPGPCQATGGPR